MKKIFVVFFLCSCHILIAQQVALKSNLLYDITTTPNLGIETAFSPKWTMDLSVNYNPWQWSNNRKIKHLLIQPELRYWLCEKFNGHFFGLHAHYALFNVGGFRELGLEKHRYEGYLYGAGVSYGYHWVLHKRWSLEANIGLGYARIHYDQYECQECGTLLNNREKNYWGITKASIALIYLLY